MFDFFESNNIDNPHLDIDDDDFLKMISLFNSIESIWANNLLNIGLDYYGINKIDSISMYKLKDILTYNLKNSDVEYSLSIVKGLLNLIDISIKSDSFILHIGI